MIIPLDRSRQFFIIGAGGLGKEVLCCIMEHWQWPGDRSNIKFVEEDKYYNSRTILGIDVIPWAAMSSDALFIIAIGEAAARKRIVSLLPSNTDYAIIVDPGVSITPYTQLNPGTIVLGKSFLSCDVHIGSHALINPATTISHDCTIGDFFTTSPGVNISGNCKIGNHVFMGTNACVRDAIRICDDVVIGMGSVVTKDITEKGTYMGNPARSIIAPDTTE